MTRRPHVLILAVLISIFSLILPLAASAAPGDLRYTDNGSTVTITGCEGGAAACPAELTIPATIHIDGRDLPVTSIGTSAFESATSLTTVTFAGTSELTTIGFAAFADARSLANITIPNTVITIGVAAFDGARSLTSITIPSTVTSIGDRAFQDASGLTTVTFAGTSQLTTIGFAVFAGARSLANITIPNTVTTIGVAAFAGAWSLTSITIPSGVTSIGDSAFRSATGLRTVTFADPSELITIGERAFEYASSLTSITIPSTVTTIGNSAFNGATDLETVTFADPSELITIGNSAFAEATSLTSITIPSTVTTIGESAFEYATSLTSVFFMGDAPTVGGEIYSDANDELVSYYFDGATGWPLVRGPANWPDDDEEADKRATAFIEAPATPPAPTAIAGNGSVAVTVAAGSGVPPFPTASYTVTAHPGGQTCTVTGAAGSCTVTGLMGGTSYTFTVTATNPAGTSSPSLPSSAVTPVGVGVPDAPTSVAGVSGNTQVVVSWLAPVNSGGSTITAYTVTASPGGRTCEWSSGTLSCTVTGLTNGTSYTFTVTATNQQGTSPASQASNAVTPTGVAVTPTGVAVTPTGVAVTPVNTFTMKLRQSSARFITTQLNLPGPGKVVQVGTTRLSPPRRSSQMAKTVRTMTVCTARKTVAKAWKVTITCRLTAKARAANKTHSLTVRLVTTFTPTGGTAKSVSKTLVLKQTRYQPPPVTG